MRAGRALALAAAIHKLVATTDPMVVKLLLRGGGGSSLLSWWRAVKRDCDWCVIYLWAHFVCGESTTLHWLKGVVGGCNYKRAICRCTTRRSLGAVSNEGRRPAPFRPPFQTPTLRVSWPNFAATRLGYSRNPNSRNLAKSRTCTSSQRKLSYSTNTLSNLI